MECNYLSLHVFCIRQNLRLYLGLYNEKTHLFLLPRVVKPTDPLTTPANVVGPLVWFQKQTLLGKPLTVPACLK